MIPIGDAEAGARHLYDLWTDKELYRRMSDFAAKCVSDEINTVGNALCWLYLARQAAEKGSNGLGGVNGKWIADLARESAGRSWEDGEPRLPRDLTETRL
jgi:hypothetical protein